MDRYDRQAAADAFFSGLVNPSPEVLARLLAEAASPDARERVQRRQHATWRGSRAYGRLAAQLRHEVEAAAFWGRVTDPANRDRVASEARKTFLDTYRSLLGGRDHGPIALEEAVTIGARSRLRDPTGKQRRVTARQQHTREVALRAEFHPAGMTEERALEIALEVLDRSPHLRW